MGSSVTTVFATIILLVLLAIIVYLFVDLYDKNKKIKELEFRCTHDLITGHTNWDWMFSQMNISTDENELPYGFVHFDIKGFKMWNELYNHRIGNEVLKFVSGKINEQDFIMYSARCHNDNFALVLDPDVKEHAVERLEQFFEDMKTVPGYEERPLYFRAGYVEKGKLLRVNDSVADMAKMAQKMGKKLNCTEIIEYDDNMREVVIRGEQLKVELPEAIMRDEILVYLQPKINPNNDELSGAEALVRWKYHGERLMFPGEFIPPLERNNAIGILDEHVLYKVCKYFEKWKAEGKKLYPISINLSQMELFKETLVDDIINIVCQHDVDRNYIEFELTESALYEDRDYMLGVMEKLKKAGFKLSMDDFGTGYSSFGVLKDMALDTLKIDKSFVDSVCREGDIKGEKIVEDLVGMAKDLSLSCVAEGVEYEEQKNALKKWGCDYIQGYYYSKPLPVEEYEEKYL